MKKAAQEKGIRKVLVASGVRMDLALRSRAYMKQLVEHHVGGHLKVAPEHADPEVLRLMRKPTIDGFEAFSQRFAALSRKARKRQYLVPYFIAGHPGCGLDAMVRLAVFLKRTGYRPQQVQDFIPTPFDVATCMYYTGLDPATGREVEVARTATERRLQRALLQFFKPENYADVRRALEQAGRTDLIGNGPDCLIPSHPPRTAAKRRKPQPRPAAESASDPRSAGYRPHRKTARPRLRG
jgi:radical SAM superfamily enzyme YgiQ (UPF0313 family)